jgi:hypothetical protein
VHPGPTNSDMNPEDGEQAEAQRQMIAVGHYGQPEDIAAAVTFLASPAAGQISGTGWTWMAVERLIALFCTSVARQRCFPAASTGSHFAAFPRFSALQYPIRNSEFI